MLGYRLFRFFFFNDTATTEIYTTHNTLSLHDALPISRRSAGRTSPRRWWPGPASAARNRSTRSEEHTSDLQSLCVISYAVFCLKKKKNTKGIQVEVLSNDNKKIKIYDASI